MRHSFIAVLALMATMSSFATESCPRPDLISQLTINEALNANYVVKATVLKNGIALRASDSSYRSFKGYELSLAEDVATEQRVVIKAGTEIIFDDAGACLGGSNDERILEICPTGDSSKDASEMLVGDLQSMIKDGLIKLEIIPYVGE